MAAKSVYLCKYSYFSWEISSRETGLVQQLASNKALLAYALYWRVC